MRLRNIDETPVVVGFEPCFYSLQVASTAQRVAPYDVIVAVNNVDIRTNFAGSLAAGSRRTSAGKRRKKDASVSGSGVGHQSNFDKIITALRATACSSNNPAGFSNSNTIGGAGSISISLSTIDSSIVCITLARPLIRSGLLLPSLSS